MSHLVTYWSPLDSTGLQWTLVDSGGLRWTPLDSTSVYAEFPPNKNSAGLWWTLADSGGLWRTPPDSGGLWRTPPDSGGLWWIESCPVESGGFHWTTNMYLSFMIDQFFIMSREKVLFARAINNLKETVSLNTLKNKSVFKGLWKTSFSSCQENKSSLQEQ